MISNPDGNGTAQTDTPAFEVYDLCKRFGDNVAVNHVSLSVPRGSFFGLVGPNGAGKTTTISMAVGLLRPDEGGARIFGIDVWQDPVRAKALVGVLPDGYALPERLTARELLTYLGELRGLDRPTIDLRVHELLAILGLDRAEKTLVIEYSAGMRKKIGLATAMIHAPRLLILDEPLEAVDPVSAATIKEILREFVIRGGSVVFSSHVMALVEQLCDRVAVINNGTVAAAGPIDAVRAGLSLEERFIELVEGHSMELRGLSWLPRSSA